MAPRKPLRWLPCAAAAIAIALTEQPPASASLSPAGEAGRRGDRIEGGSYATLGGLVPYAASASGWAYEVSVQALATRRACFPNLGTLVATPSAVLTDYYGLQALNASALGNVSAVAAAAGWSVVSATPSVTRVVLNPNVTADFYATPLPLLLSTQYVGTNASILPDTVFAEVLVSDPCAFLTGVAALRDALAASAPAYLPLNPYYSVEGVTALLLVLTAGWGNNITTLPSVDAFAPLAAAGSNATLVIEDAFPNLVPTVVDATLATLAVPRLSWFALQALPVTSQDDLTTYLTAAAGSAPYLAAQAALQNVVPPGYFQFIAAARAAGITRGAAVDAPLAYQVYRYGPYYFASGTRNILWAATCGATAGAGGGGSGVLLASGTHFSATLAPLFEAALAMYAPPASTLYLLAAVPPPTPLLWMYAQWWAVLLGTIALSLLLFALAVCLLLRPHRDDWFPKATMRAARSSLPGGAAYSALPGS